MVFQAKSLMSMKVRQGHGIIVLASCHPFVTLIFNLHSSAQLIFIKDSPGVGVYAESGGYGMSKTDALSVLMDLIVCGSVMLTMHHE